MTDKKEFHLLINKLSSRMNEYVISKDSVDDVYYTAKKFIASMTEKAWKNEAYRDKVGKWLKKQASTLLLRDILKEVGCDYWGNLVHSNAADLLDTISVYKN